MSSILSCGSRGSRFDPTTRFIHSMFCSIRDTTVAHSRAVWRLGSGSAWHWPQASRKDFAASLSRSG